MCKELQRQLQSEDVFVLGSVSVHGICTTDLSREPSGYRGMSALDREQALSYGHTRDGIEKYHCSCKRESRLSDIRGFCTEDDSYSTKPLWWRFIRSGAGADSICVRCDDNRFVSFGFSMGAISETQGSGKTTYSFGFTGIDPNNNPDNAWENTRCQYTGLPQFRADGDIYNGSWIYGFSATLPDTWSRSVLCHKSQAQSEFSTVVFKSGGQVCGRHGGSDNHNSGLLHPQRLSGKTAADKIPGFGNRQDTGVSDQQLCASGADNSATVQMPVADRIIFQMDKTTPANQGVLRHFRECGQDADMDCDISICARSDNQEAAELAPQPLHNSTDFKRNSFRENAGFTGVPCRSLQKHKYLFRQPADFAMITLGQ